MSTSGSDRTAAIDELVAREQIHDVIKRYVRAVDRADATLMASCYHPDGYDDHGSFRGPATDFAAFVCGERSQRYDSTHHFVAAPHFDIRGEVAHVDTYCIAHQITPPGEAGRRIDHVVGLRYLDRFERREQQWLIAHRTAVFDWTYSVEIDESVSRKLGPDWETGSRNRDDLWYHMDRLVPPGRT